jgi:hypothetical protein
MTRGPTWLGSEAPDDVWELFDPCPLEHLHPFVHSGPEYVKDCSVGSLCLAIGTRVGHRRVVDLDELSS